MSLSLPLHCFQMTAVLKNYACAERKQTPHTHMQHRNFPVGFDPLHFSAESCGISSRSYHNAWHMGHAGRGPCDARIEGRIHRRKVNPGLRLCSHSNARCMSRIYTCILVFVALQRLPCVNEAQDSVTVVVLAFVCMIAWCVRGLSRALHSARPRPTRRWSWQHVCSLASVLLRIHLSCVSW